MPKDILKTATGLHNVIVSLTSWIHKGKKIINPPQIASQSISLKTFYDLIVGYSRTFLELLLKMFSLVAASVYTVIEAAYQLRSQVFSLTIVQSAYLFIFDTDFLPLCSCVLIIGSLVCLSLALRGVSTVSHQQISEENSDISSKRSESEYSCVTPPHTPRRMSNASSAMTSPRSPKHSPRFAETQQDLLRNFAFLKSKDMGSLSPLRSVQKKKLEAEERARTIPNVLFADQSISDKNNSDNLSENLNGTSDMNSDGNSFKEEEYCNYEKDNETVYTAGTDDEMESKVTLNTEEIVFLESMNNPSALIGWQIEVLQKGIGIVLGIKRTLGRPTKFEIQFDNGDIDFLPLKRSPTKGSIYFSPIKKMSI